MGSAQLIPIGEWATNLLGEHCPHRNTLRNWIHKGKISPPPVKVGSRFYCKPEARYVDPRQIRLERLINGS